MKLTLELPDELAKRVKLLAVQEDQKLKDMVAELLRRGLSAINNGARPSSTPSTTSGSTSGSTTGTSADKAMLKQRKGITRKFVSGEWGVELAGFDENRAADRRKESKRDNSRRD